MENEGIGGLFVCEDYVIENFDFEGKISNSPLLPDVNLKLYCLKSSVTDFDLTGQIVWPAAVFLSELVLSKFSEDVDILSRTRACFKTKKLSSWDQGQGSVDLSLRNLVCFIMILTVAKQVLLTDHNDTVVKLLEKNAEYLAQDK